MQHGKKLAESMFVVQVPTAKTRYYLRYLSKLGADVHLTPAPGYLVSDREITGLPSSVKFMKVDEFSWRPSSTGQIKEGMLVEVVRGPSAGFIGSVIRVAGDIVVVALSVFGKPVKCDLKLCEIEPLSVPVWLL